MIAGSIDQGQRAGGAFGGASNVGMSFPGYHSGGEPSYATALQLQSRHAESQQDTDIFDEAAFDRAFENARAQIQRAEEDIQKAKNVQADDAALVHTRVDPNGLVETRYWDDLSLENLGEMKRDANPYSHQHLNNQSSEPPQARSRPTADSQDTKPHDADVDADELAQTAGQLLSSVSNNTTQKFQDSAFLALMRRLRDREVRVEGDRMVEVSRPPPTFSFPSTSSLASSSITRSDARDGEGEVSRSYSQHRHRHLPPDPEHVTCQVFGCEPLFQTPVADLLGLLVVTDRLLLPPPPPFHRLQSLNQVRLPESVSQPICRTRI